MPIDAYKTLSMLSPAFSVSFFMNTISCHEQINNDIIEKYKSHILIHNNDLRARMLQYEPVILHYDSRNCSLIVSKKTIYQFKPRFSIIFDAKM